MSNEQVAHDLTMFVMNHSHYLDNDGVDFTVLNDDDLVVEYKKQFNKILDYLNNN